MANKTAKAPGGRAWWKLAVAGIAAFTVAAILLTLFTGYRSVVFRMTRAINKNKPATLAALLLDPEGTENLEDYSRAYIAMIRGEMIDMLESEKIRVTSEITGVDKADQQELAEINKAVTYYSEDFPTIKQKLDLEVTFTGKAGDRTHSIVKHFEAVKLHDGWKVIPID
ncbi:MAG: hypothetical protein IKN72_11560 [Clostridia bacterium]|nr:hypothetical protein [Clostridia bacterium]MBR3554003.1 hypothetical protein [Clostridia bacterium]